MYKRWRQKRCRQKQLQLEAQLKELLKYQADVEHKAHTTLSFRKKLPKHLQEINTHRHYILTEIKKLERSNYNSNSLFKQISFKHFFAFLIVLFIPFFLYFTVSPGDSITGAATNSPLISIQNTDFGGGTLDFFNETFPGPSLNQSFWKNYTNGMSGTIQWTHIFEREENYGTEFNADASNNEFGSASLVTYENISSNDSFLLVLSLNLLDTSSTFNMENETVVNNTASYVDIGILNESAFEISFQKLCRLFIDGTGEYTYGLFNNTQSGSTAGENLSAASGVGNLTFNYSTDNGGVFGCSWQDNNGEYQESSASTDLPTGGIVIGYQAGIRYNAFTMSPIYVNGTHNSSVYDLNYMGQASAGGGGETAVVPSFFDYFNTFLNSSFYWVYENSNLQSVNVSVPEYELLFNGTINVTGDQDGPNSRVQLQFVENSSSFNYSAWVHLSNLTVQTISGNNWLSNVGLIIFNGTNETSFSSSSSSDESFFCTVTEFAKPNSVPYYILTGGNNSQQASFGSVNLTHSSNDGVNGTLQLRADYTEANFIEGNCTFTNSSGNVVDSVMWNYTLSNTDYYPSISSGVSSGQLATNVTGLFSAKADNLTYDYGEGSFSEYPTGTSDESINNIPSIPNLILPVTNTSITNRTQGFVWTNSVDLDSDSLTYNFILDDNPTFNNPEINESNLNETGSFNTTYEIGVTLDVDTTYYWKVRSYDGEDYSNYSDVSNVTVNSYLAISLIDSTIAFGNVSLNDRINSTLSGYTPFRGENAGNIIINISVTATPYFDTIPFPSFYYQFKIAENETSSFNLSQSETTWSNMSNVSSNTHIVNLNWVDFKDDFLTHLLVQIPPEELSASKNSTITFTAE